MKIKMNKKIGVGIAAVSVVSVIGAVAKAFDEHGRKSFYKGFDVGKLIGDLTTAEKFAHKQTELRRKYDEISTQLDELEARYDDLMTDYNEMQDFYEGE